MAGTFMPSIGSFLCGVMLLGVFYAQALRAQLQQGASNTPTIRVTSRLVFLDVTVLDKKGHVVVKGLTKDDFAITEEKKPQRIFSFEEPQTHVADTNAADDNPAGKAPLTILVLDLLNSRFEDFAYIRYSVRKYLAAQPARLTSPAELMVLGNESLEMVQGYTRNKEDLLYALDHVPAALPYKMKRSLLPRAVWAIDRCAATDCAAERGRAGAEEHCLGGTWRPQHLYRNPGRSHSGRTEPVCA